MTTATLTAPAESLRQKTAPASTKVIDCKLDKIYYGDFLAVRDSHVPIEKGKITGFIGPSGCGKSTVLRSLNRMNDLVRGFRFEGHVHFHGQDIYGKDVDAVVVRRYIGMVFQQPNPFSMSIFDNVAFGLRLNRVKTNVAERVEKALRRAALWDEVKDKLKSERPVAVRRAAAAPVHRARHGDRARRAADGRAVLGAGPDRDAADRGADGGAQAELHHRAGHPQHAAGACAWPTPPRSSRWTSPRAAAPATWSRWARPGRSSRIPARS